MLSDFLLISISIAQCIIMAYTLTYKATTVFDNYILFLSDI